jgi:general secretion pathway protein F
VRGGKSLADALTAYPTTFSRLYVGMVTAGESGGALADTLARLATMLEREQSLNATVRSALAYPIVLVAAAIGSIVLLLVWVLPQFAPIFAQAGAKLPTATRILMGLGDTVQKNGVWLLVAIVTSVILLRQLARQPAQRRRIDALVLRLPVAGTLIRQVNAARLARTLGTLLANGVGLLAALSISRQVLSNQVAIEAVDQAAVQAREGQGIAAALSQGGAFPPDAVHLLKLGSETGRLAEMALRSADIQEEQVRSGTQQLVALMVPIITVAMGAIVAAIVGSLLVAMMSLNDLAG